MVTTFRPPGGAVNVRIDRAGGVRATLSAYVAVNVTHARTDRGRATLSLPDPATHTQTQPLTGAVARSGAHDARPATTAEPALPH
jgi:hypothetical protein